MKKILIIIFSLLLFNVIFLNSYLRNSKAQVIISVDNLLTDDVVESLENDLNEHPGVEFIEGSLLTGIIVLEITDDDLELNPLKIVFDRWGCNIKNIDYRMLN